MSEAGKRFGFASLRTDGSKNDTDSDYNTEPSIIENNFFILQPKKVVAILIQEIVIVKLITIIKWLGTIFEQIFLLLNATMFNKYSFLE